MDSMHSTHAISTFVRTVENTSENFDAISYEKGACILRNF